jgi:hypothetical protein
MQMTDVRHYTRVEDVFVQIWNNALLLIVQKIGHPSTWDIAAFSQERGFFQQGNSLDMRQ